ncbi:hypothetical protein PCANC_04862 [Puccinia coronata f. sp. avenae]|uniref:Uncharacterized protein n=1 Tax=Puccinia coronata f. sp. avenae TaxID=200324 RepID=A0A2N5W2P2_9BASI|nr:hypothetical protein PCANC_04862 [Puccinia coronata f. sp. avenae]
MEMACRDVFLASDRPRELLKAQARSLCKCCPRQPHCWHSDWEIGSGGPNVRRQQCPAAAGPTSRVSTAPQTEEAHRDPARPLSYTNSVAGSGLEQLHRLMNMAQGVMAVGLLPYCCTRDCHPIWEGPRPAPGPSAPAGLLNSGLVPQEPSEGGTGRASPTDSLQGIISNGSAIARPGANFGGPHAVVVLQRSRDRSCQRWRGWTHPAFGCYLWQLCPTEIHPRHQSTVHKLDKCDTSVTLWDICLQPARARPTHPQTFGDAPSSGGCTCLTGT